MSFFKFLDHGAVGPITGHVWRPGEWVEAKGELAVCSRGVHVLRPRDLAPWIHRELWRAEIDGDAVDGVDCLVVRRARVTEPVEEWTGGGGERFARACLDRLSALMADPGYANVKEHLASYHWAVGWHLERKNAAMAGYVSALGIAQVTPAGTPLDRFRAERALQSEWLVRELHLVE